MLDKAGADRTDAYIAVTSGDNSNVVSATIAREIYRIPKVVARIFDPRRAEIYRRLGIQTVSSVAWATNEIVALVMFQHLVRDVSMGGGEVQLVKVSIPPRLAGRTVNDLSSPGEILPVAIVRGGDLVHPDVARSAPRRRRARGRRPYRRHEPLREHDQPVGGCNASTHRRRG